MTWITPRPVAIRPFVLKLRTTALTVVRCTPSRPAKRLLGQLDPVAGAVLRVEQPARRALAGSSGRRCTPTDCMTCDSR